MNWSCDSCEIFDILLVVLYLADEFVGLRQRDWWQHRGNGLDFVRRWFHLAIG